MDFHLFRIKVVWPSQKDLFRRDRTPQDLLRTAILARPKAPSQRGVEWHIGNVEEFHATNIYFALGREARARIPVIDSAGNFAETDFDSAPYTHVFVDVPTEVCAIAHKTTLAPTTEAISRQLERVLNNSPVADETQIRFTASPIRQPDEFLRQLREAYAVTSFSVYFTRPNPVDVEDDFLKPMERLTEATNGTEGKTTIKGVALDSEPLTELARSAASTGDNASARLRPRAGARTVHRSLKGATAKLTPEAIDTREDKIGFFEAIREKYFRIRGTITDEAS